jgi:hypothetical protein
VRLVFVRTKFWDIGRCRVPTRLSADESPAYGVDVGSADAGVEEVVLGVESVEGVQDGVFSRGASRTGRAIRGALRTAATYALPTSSIRTEMRPLSGQRCSHWRL